MAKVYAFSLINAIFRAFRCRLKGEQKRGLLLVMLFTFMSARSILDAAETSGVPKRVFYDGVESLQPYALLMGIRRQGLCRLSIHLARLRQSDTSVKSRECVTLCGDDFVREVRGDMGGLAHPCYSGAEKKVVYGLRIQALVAVIGDRDEVIILDVRIIPPKHEGSGRERHTHGEWLQAALERIRTDLQEEGESIESCYLSVDSAYASGPFVRFARGLKLKVVSELKSNLITWSWFWLPVPAGIYFNLFEIGHRDSFKLLSAEPGVEFLRHQIVTRVYGVTRVVLLHIKGETKRLFTTDPEMKTITVRRVAKRRWQLERIFWNSKQLLELKTIHQEIKEHVQVRIYLVFVLAQAVKDCTRENKITPEQLHKILRRDHPALLTEISIHGGSVHRVAGNPSVEERLAA